MISSVLTANYEVIHFSRKTIWKGTYQVSHLLTVFSSSANFYIYIAKVAKKIVFKVTNVCYMPLTFDVSEYLHFQHGHPCSQSKEASETTEAVLVTNNGANSIPLPSVSVQFIHVQPLRNDFVISLPVLKYWRRCPPAVLLWRLTRQRWRRPSSWNQNKNQNVALIISFESWFYNADFGQNEKNYNLELKCVSQFCFPLCFFLGPSKTLMISKIKPNF